MSALLDPGDGNDWREDDYITITDAARAISTHPESARHYRDITDRDRHGCLLASRRVVTCQPPCGAVITDTPVTYPCRRQT